MTHQWQRLSDALDSPGPDRGVHQLYPDAEVQISLIQALDEAGIGVDARAAQVGANLKERLVALLNQVHAWSSIGAFPVVGVTGLLNSGKSSLLATFLSPEGRRRVLRGSANNQGTQRFVLWLPRLWRQRPELLDGFQELLEHMFGNVPELLSDQPPEAFAQYNGQLLDQRERGSIDPLSVPLLAYDGGLDDQGLALLDCPDIQTAFTDTGNRLADDGTSVALASVTSRRQQLARIGRLCSAFLVVSKMSSLHDETLLAILETLRDTMPGVRRILAVNKVKARYTPEVVDEQSQSLVDRFQISEVYMAYDYRSHWAQQRLPEPPASLRLENHDPLPIFFRSGLPAGSMPVVQAVEPAAQTAASLGYRPPHVLRYLQDLGRLLDPGALVIERHRSLAGQLEQAAQASVAWVQSNTEAREQQLHEAWQTVADACFAFMAERDAASSAVGLRLQTSPAIVAQMSDSLVRAAPWSMKPSLAIDRSVRQLQGAIAGGVQRLRWLQSASAGVTDFLGRFRQGHTGKIVTAERFAQQLQRGDRSGLFEQTAASQLQQACELALVRFRAEDVVRLDSQWLDQWANEVWRQMSLKRKLYVGILPLAPVFGPLLAVTLIPFDSGGTAVLVFATTKELLMAAGISALAVPATLGSEVQDLVESETALSQLGELFALTCDSLGLPRPTIEMMPRIELAGQRRALTVSHLPVKPAAGKPLVPMWRLATGFEQSLHSGFSELHTQVGTSRST